MHISANDFFNQYGLECISLVKNSCTALSFELTQPQGSWQPCKWLWVEILMM
jgi:hypothetical protein